jgi:hypothetical protein
MSAGHSAFYIKRQITAPALRFSTFILDGLQ